jgi:hypothetical protein
MDLFDDDLMSMVFDGNIEATELLLRVILKRDDITVVSVVGQREFQNPVWEVGISGWIFWQRIAQASTIMLKCRKNRKAHTSAGHDLIAA